MRNWNRTVGLYQLALFVFVATAWVPAFAQQHMRALTVYDDFEDGPATEQASPARPSRPATTTDGSIEVHADRLEYNADRSLVIGIGNVMVRQHGDTLRADYLQVHTETQEAVARGNVFFDRSGRTWEGDELTYNFITRAVDFGEFQAFSDPYYIHARDFEQKAPNVIYLQSPRLTTCSGDDLQEFVMRARRATVTDESVMRARHVVTFLYGVPVFYTPYLKKDFTKKSNIDIMPGYRSRYGAFLLTAYNFYPTPYIKASTHLDYRSKRGFGYGQQVRWRLPENNARGRIRGYYTADDLPIRSEGQRAIREGLVDTDRYWLGFNHAQSVGPRQSLITELNYVSDPFVLEDFFDRDFRRGVQPENRVTLTHRGENFTAALLLNMRLNDFYENVNRLPEASLDISRRQIFTTPFYYESENSAAYLERVQPKRSDRREYDAVRVDSSHTVLYPTRHFGFLSVIPSVGYRGTWYSQTPETFVFTNLVARLEEDEEGEAVFLRDEEGNVLFEEETETVVRDGAAELRNLLTFGLETSFKAFKALNDHPNYLGEGLRHVAEPYARYTLVPEPNLRPSELYRFDAIDRLDERHDIRFGIRNKLQTRRGRWAHTQEDEFPSVVGDPVEEARPVIRIHDFIDINTYTIFRIDPDEDENDFDDFFFETRLRLTDWMRIDFDGAYDGYENEINTFNTQLALIARDRSSLGLEYRYRLDQRHTVQAEVVLFPRAKWSYSAYWRYDLDNSELEEHSYLIQRRFDCTMLGIGVRGRLQEDDDTEWRAWAQISLLAFPDSELRIGR